MENITIVLDSNGDENVVIDRGNGEFTSMPKANYDAMIEQQAALKK